jgi:transcriptional regulator with XRE-family HTH domain
MTQQEFAQRIGISQSFLSTVEHGRVEAGAAVLLAISQEFGRSLEWLLTGQN